jgi:hypothetical protein
MRVHDARVAQIRARQFAADKAHTSHGGMAKIGIVKIARLKHRIREVGGKEAGERRAAGLPMAALQPRLGQVNPAHGATFKPPTGQIEIGQFGFIQITFDQVDTIGIAASKRRDIIA